MLRFALVLAALLVSPPAVSARTWNINPAGTGDAATIQAGIDSSAAGDTVLLAEGTYFEHGLTLSTDVSLVGPSPQGSVIIDGQRLGAILTCQSLTAAPTITRITFTNGLSDFGAVILRDVALTMESCIFHDNEGGFAGGLTIEDSNVTLTRCEFRDNRSFDGGGIGGFSGSISIIDCQFTDNNALGDGGGIYAGGASIEIRNCLFLRNEAGSEGGGVFLTGGPISIRDCTFRRQFAGHGAGVFLRSSQQAEIMGCTISNNYADGGGGAIAITQSENVTVLDCTMDSNGERTGGAVLSSSTVSFTRCRFTNNGAIPWEGGAFRVNSGLVTLEMCTLAGNQAPAGASAIFLRSTAEAILKNCIVAFGTRTPIVCFSDESSATLSCSNLFGNVDGNWIDCVQGQESERGNFSADPLFCDPDAGDYHLQWASPCLPANSPDGCGLIGAFGFGGCNSVSVTPESWARVKARYR